MNSSEPGAGATAKWSVSDWLRQRWQAIQCWAENFVAGKFWLLKLTFLSVAFSLLCAGGLDLHNLKNGYYPVYFQKIQHPLADMSKIYEHGSHEAKLNYRIAVPVLLHPLNLTEQQALRWVLPALTILAVILTILFSGLVAFQITGDRVTGLFMALLTGSTYLGSFGFILCYDAITMAQVLLALSPRVPWPVKSLLAFSASFTDERGFVAAGFILAGEFCLVQRGWVRAIWNRNTLGMIAGLAAYWVVRLVLGRWFDLPSPTKGVGPGSFVGHIKHWHAGIWFALEGGWLLVGLAFVIAWHQRRRLKIALLSAVLLAFFGLCFCNGDLVRTTCYVLPLLFVALRSIADHDRPQLVRLYCFLAFLISAIGGSYNVYMDEITWFMPLPVQLLNEAAQDIYIVFRIYVFGGMP